MGIVEEDAYMGKVILRRRLKITNKKIGKTLFIISSHYSGKKNIVQKIGAMILKDFKDTGEK